MLLLMFLVVALVAPLCIGYALAQATRELPAGCSFSIGIAVAFMYMIICATLVW